METIQTVLMVVQVLTAVTLIGFILIQQGKGADAGAAFGSGASATVFGASGSGNFLSRTTSVLAAIFLINSLALAWVAKERTLEVGSVMEGAVSTEVVPAQNAAVDASVPVADPVSEVPVAPDSEVPAAPTTESEVPKAPE